MNEEEAINLAVKAVRAASMRDSASGDGIDVLIINKNGVKEVSENLDVWRRAIPPETMHTTELAWDVSEKTRLELYMIWKLTGNLEMIENIDEGIFMILEEVMEELLEEHGYDIDDFENVLED